MSMAALLMKVKSALSCRGKRPEWRGSKMATKKGSSIMPELADVIMLALLVGCFAVAFAYARLCDRVLGHVPSRDLSS